MPQTIHDACRDGNVEAVRQLLATDPTFVDADDEHRWRPLFHAALYGRLDVVKLLIANGADVAAHNGDALHYAAEVPGNKEIVRLLITYGALDAHVRPTDDLSRQFFAALFLGEASRVETLLKRHPELATQPDGRGDLPIHHAARNGDTQIVEILIDHGADVNAITERGHTVLYCAGGHGHHDIVRLLLEHSANAQVRFTHDGKTLLEWLNQYPDDTRYVEVRRVLSGGDL